MHSFRIDRINRQHLHAHAHADYTMPQHVHYLQALLDDIEQDEEAEEVHATHGNGPQQIRPEEAVFCAHSVVVPTCAAPLLCRGNLAHT